MPCCLERLAPRWEFDCPLRPMVGCPDRLELPRPLKRPLRPMVGCPDRLELPRPPAAPRRCHMREKNCRICSARSPPESLPRLELPRPLRPTAGCPDRLAARFDPADPLRLLAGCPVRLPRLGADFFLACCFEAARLPRFLSLLGSCWLARAPSATSVRISGRIQSPDLSVMMSSSARYGRSGLSSSATTRVGDRYCRLPADTQLATTGNVLEPVF